MKNPANASILLEKIRTEYRLTIPGTGKKIKDDGFILFSPEHPDKLLRTEYSAKNLNVGNDKLGIYKFADWLPVNKFLTGSSAPVTYKSKGLSKALNIPNLYITFSGYWPEKNVWMETGTFKECEAFTVCGRLPEDFQDVLVVASAGNTARAFARVCSENNIKLLLVVPDTRRAKIWFKEELNDCVKLVTVGGYSDYYDAIKVADEICRFDGFLAEGGAKNVARRDGMATTVLSAVTTIGEIPDFYFQAVGSGTGAIAAWEATLRFNESDDFSGKIMKLHVAQNDPFTPMYDAWKANCRELLPMEPAESKKKLSKIYADVLANRKPPFSIHGGLFDALTDTNGDMHKVTNDEAKDAAAFFFEKEGIDIEPAAAVATASLVNFSQQHAFDDDQIVMLNITGGGIERFKNENSITHLKPSFVFDIDEWNAERDIEKIAALFE